MHAYKLVKEFGEGVDRMYREMADAGNPEPHFAQVEFMVKATIKQRTGVAEDVAVNVAEELTERQRNILKLIGSGVADDVAVNTMYLADALGLNRKTIQRDLAVLTGLSLIVWEGSPKTGGWKIKG